MDAKTLEAYLANDGEYIRSYDVADVSSDLFALAFSTSSKVLDIGCGSGRDMRLMQKLGIQVDG